MDIKQTRLVLCGLVTLGCTLTGLAAPDLWMRDDPSDVGNEPNNQSAVLYLSDDIWVRRLPDPNYDPEPFPTASPTWTPQPHQGPCYRDPKTGSPNYLYVRIRNRGSSASLGTETLRVYWAKASTGLSWPGDWNDHLDNPCGGPLRLYGYEVTKPRRNAATVPAAVRNAYVQAVTNIDTAAFQFPDLSTYFDKQNTVHNTLFGLGIHNSLRFLPWHREFMNRYEALLREVKPELTLLYWDWTTDPSPTIIGPTGYMGASSGVVGAPFVGFGISRNKFAGTPSAFDSDLSAGYQSGTLMPSGTYASFWGNIEVPTHNQAHNYNSGTLASGNAARDPLFFMLHANCDRVWAMWQRFNSSNVDRWTPSQAYDASQANAAITSTLRPWDGTDAMSPWLNQIPGDPNGYVILKTPAHPSIVFPPIYEDVLLKIPVLDPNESCIIEIPFYPPRATECASFSDPQHLCLLARIEPMPAPAEGPGLWQNVKDHNNIAWRNVTLSDCNVGPFFLLAPGRIGAAGELIRNFRGEPARLRLRFAEAPASTRSLFQFGHVRLRLADNLLAAWDRGGRQGRGIEPVGQNEILVLQNGAELANLVMDKREAGYMDVALELRRDYEHPFGDVYHLDVLQYDDQGGQEPVGGQRYELDFNLLPIVRKGSDWKFLDGGQVPVNEGWTALDFDDRLWRTGPAPFGYGRTDVATGLQGRPDGSPPTAFFRQVFEVPDPSFFRSLALDLLQDDGIVVYLNGKEILRQNMPTGPIEPDTFALAPVDGAAARACRTVRIDNSLGLLNRGRNVLAAEVHPARQAPKEPDLTFDLGLAGNVPDAPWQPPTVVIETPGNGSLFPRGVEVPIVADVFDPDGDLAEVLILADGVLLGRFSQPPFAATLRGHALGTHRVSVRATDRFGNSARSEAVFSVASNLVPVVRITQPLSGRTFQAGEMIVLQAAAEDPDGDQVTEVSFRLRAHSRFGIPQPLGTDHSPPFMAAIPGLPPGHYFVVAEARDERQAAGYAPPVHFTVAEGTGPRLRMNFATLGGAPVVTLEWQAHGAVLERAPRVTGPWTPIADADSPYPVEPRPFSEFYRLRLTH